MTVRTQRHTTTRAVSAVLTTAMLVIILAAAGGGTARRADLRLSADQASTGAGVASSGAGPLGPVERIGATRRSYGEAPVLVTGPRGVSTVIWSEGCAFWSARRSPTGGWSEPVLAVRGSRTSTDCTAPLVGVDVSGTVTLVWEHWHGYTRINVMVATLHPGRPWTSPLQLTRGRRFDYGYAAGLSVAPSGAAIVTWERLSGTHAVALVKPRGTSWSRARPVDLRGAVSAYTQAIASNGSALVVSDDHQVTNSQMYVRRYTPRHGWSKRTSLGNGENPSVVMNNRGEAAATWGASRGLVSSYVPRVRRMTATGHWRPSHRLASRHAEDIVTLAAIGSRGEVGVAATREAVLRAWSSRGHGRWVSTQLARDPRWPVLDRLVTNAAGDLALLWGTSGDLTRQQVRAIVRPAHPVRRVRTGWSLSRLVGESGCKDLGRAGVACTGSDITALSGGRALVVWFTRAGDLVARVVRP